MVLVEPYRALRVRATGELAWRALEPDPGAPLLVDTSRERLPDAADLLGTEDPAGTN